MTCFVRYCLLVKDMKKMCRRLPLLCTDLYAQFKTRSCGLRMCSCVRFFKYLGNKIYILFDQNIYIGQTAFLFLKVNFMLPHIQAQLY